MGIVKKETYVRDKTGGTVIIETYADESGIPASIQETYIDADGNEKIWEVVKKETYKATPESKERMVRKLLYEKITGEKTNWNTFYKIVFSNLNLKEFLGDNYSSEIVETFEWFIDEYKENPYSNLKDYSLHKQFYKELGRFVEIEVANDIGYNFIKQLEEITQNLYNEMLFTNDEINKEYENYLISLE